MAKITYGRRVPIEAFFILEVFEKVTAGNPAESKGEYTPRSRSKFTAFFLAAYIVHERAKK